MKDSDPNLRAAFLKDHQTFTRGLSRILKALRDQDDALAVGLAEELDRDVGPHIEFEEQQFYPELKKRLDAPFVEQLYREHATGQRAIATLLDLRGAGELTADARDEVIRMLTQTMDHALSCGSLLSHLDGLGDERQADLLHELQESRNRGRRWTERPERRARSES